MKFYVYAELYQTEVVRLEIEADSEESAIKKMNEELLKYNYNDSTVFIYDNKEDYDNYET